MFRLNKIRLKLLWLTPLILSNTYIVLYYVLRNNLTNYYVISNKDIFYYVLACFSVLFLLFKLFRIFLSYKKAALMLFMLQGLIFYFNNSFQPSEQPLLLFHELLIPCLLLIVYFLLWKNCHHRIIYKIINFVGICLLCICLLNNLVPGYRYVNAIRNASKAYTSFLTEDECPHFAGDKNIIFIVLDGHISKHCISDPYYLQKYLQFEKFLTDKGFYIVPNSFANYPFTLYALPSMLNFNYLDKMSFSYQGNELVAFSKYFYKHNLMARLLKRYGYNVTLINNFNVVYNKFKSSDQNYASSKILTNMLFHDIRFIPSASHIKFTQYAKAKSLNHSLSLLRKEVNQNKEHPKFIFMHLLFPHEPYVVNEQGKVGFSTYLEQMTYTDQVIQTEIEHILKYASNSIIILMSNHGYYTDYERMSNFIALYTPDKNYSFLGRDPISNVNFLRKVFNKEFSCNFATLEDEVFYTDNWATHPQPQRIALDHTNRNLQPYPTNR